MYDSGMSDNNQLPPVILENHRRLLAFLKPRVAADRSAESALRAAYAAGYEKSGELKETEKVISWFTGLLQGLLANRKDRDLEPIVRDCVSELVKTLKPEYADVIKKAELQDKTIKDLAHHERTSPNVISMRLHRARESLKKKLLQTCGACATHGRMDCSCLRPAAGPRD